MGQTAVVGFYADGSFCHADIITEKIRVVYNVHRIILKDDKGNTVLNIPLTVATAGTIAAPVLARV